MSRVNYLIFKGDRLIAFALYPSSFTPVQALYNWVCKWYKEEHFDQYSIAIWDKSSSDRGAINVLCKGDLLL